MFVRWWKCARKRKHFFCVCDHTSSIFTQPFVRGLDLYCDRHETHLNFLEEYISTNSTRDLSVSCVRRISVSLFAGKRELFVTESRSESESVYFSFCVYHGTQMQLLRPRDKVPNLHSTRYLLQSGKEREQKNWEGLLSKRFTLPLCLDWDFRERFFP